MQICASSLRRSILPGIVLPWTVNLVFWPMNVAVDDCPPVLE
jgi:hypothetical protein